MTTQNKVNEQEIFNGKTVFEIISDYARMIKSQQPKADLVMVLDLVDNMLDIWNIAKSPKERYEYYMAAREGYNKQK